MCLRQLLSLNANSCVFVNSCHSTPTHVSASTPDTQRQLTCGASGGLGGAHPTDSPWHHTAFSARGGHVDHSHHCEYPLHRRTVRVPMPPPPPPHTHHTPHSHTHTLTHTQLTQPHDRHNHQCLHHKSQHHQYHHHHHHHRPPTRLQPTRYNVLGSAGPDSGYYVYDSNNVRYAMTWSAHMQFDSADVAWMVTANTFGEHLHWTIQSPSTFAKRL
jgi:hypothetical protein